MQKLKLKFILIASVSFFLVLITVLSVVNYISYRSIYSEIYTTLRIITKNGGLPDYINNEYKNYDDFFVTPETIYETRYFTVEYDNNMNITIYLVFIDFDNCCWNICINKEFIRNTYNNI